MNKILIIAVIGGIAFFAVRKIQSEAIEFIEAHADADFRAPLVLPAADVVQSVEIDVYNEWTNENETMIRTYSYRDHPLMMLIQKYESGGRYDVVYGGRRFTDFSLHPYAVGGEFQRQGIKPAIITRGINKGKFSSAAGRYQFLMPVWKEVSKKIGITDFSPDSQDRGAYEMCNQIGALSAYNRGDYETAIRLCAKKWTSLPSATTGEVATTMNSALRELASYA